MCRPSKTESDERGYIQLDGFRPGRWSVDITYPQGTRHGLPVLEIPDPPPSLVDYEPRIGTASITGRVIQGRTTLDPATLREYTDKLGRTWVGLLFGNEASARTRLHRSVDEKGLFEIHGLQAGTYRIEAGAEGFSAVRSGAFTLSPGARTDVGTLELVPQSLLAIRCEDALGRMLRFVQFGFPEIENLERARSRKSGAFLFHPILPGTYAVRLTCRGYREKNLSITVGEGEWRFERVVLDRIE